MMRFTSAAVVSIILISGARAEVIKPNDVRATSQFGVGANVENLVNGDQGPAVGLDPNGAPVFGLNHFGLIPSGGPGVLDDLHDVSVGGATSVAAWGWISGCNDAGIPGGDPGVSDCSGFNGFLVEPVDDQIVEFEFDGAYDLTDLHIWNNNEDGAAPDRGVNEFEIQVSTTRTGDTFTAVGTTYNIAADSGFSANAAQTIPLVASGIRRVRLLINTRHGGSSEDYVGLSEVRFSGTLNTLDAAADGDKDGHVSGFDFLLWQRNRGLGEIDNYESNGSNAFNSTLTATQSEGDYDNNNVINFDDYAAWEAGFGTSSPLGGLSGAAIPEPSSLLLAAAATLGSFLSRRRRYRRL
ncbi:MAG: PEP-CTERM sorting domain-containing protein [Planctomycetales bacterium]|nr:PEP-CTERM sorting domain-containing protein [Planctomycetales bacterium]